MSKRPLSRNQMRNLFPLFKVTQCYVYACSSALRSVRFSTLRCAALQETHAALRCAATITKKAYAALRCAANVNKMIGEGILGYANSAIMRMLKKESKPITHSLTTSCTNIADGGHGKETRNPSARPGAPLRWT